MLVPQTAFLLALAAAFAPQAGEAPDGRPGFGRVSKVRELRGLFLTRDAEERRFLDELRELARAVREERAELERRYRSRSWFALVPQERSATLESLHEELELARAEAAVRLERGGASALALAEMLADLRARLRARVLAGCERELQDLDGGLALLAATFDGWAELDDLDLSRIGPRLDLAAASLRAMRLDLAALRADEPPDPEALALLVARARGRPEPDGLGLEQTLERLAAREQAMRAVLASERLAPKLAALRAWRAETLQAASKRSPEVRRLLPEAPEGREPGPDVARLTKAERHARAALIAGEALAFDPLDAELCYWAGVAEDFQWGAVRSRRWFDRFLALRGIRPHDAKSYDLERLDAYERDALERLTLRAPPPFPPFPPR